MAGMCQTYSNNKFFYNYVSILGHSFLSILGHSLKEQSKNTYTCENVPQMFYNLHVKKNGVI